jgi:hypothetical protein
MKSGDNPQDDSRTNREKLEAELMTGMWQDLQPHSERGALFLVSQGLDLIDVGLAVMTDQTADVQKWLKGGQMNRPSPIQLAQWAAEPTKSFSFLILAPYVLIQELAH